MFARYSTVRARAVQRQLPNSVGKQRQSHRVEHILDVRRHLVGQQGGGIPGIFGQCTFDLRPFVLPEGGDADAHPIGTGPATLHLCGHETRTDIERNHLSPTGIVAAPLQPAADTHGLQHLDEPLRPPGLADGTARAASLDAAVDLTRPRRRIPVTHRQPLPTG